jgi:anti-sigma factor RsiW
MNCTRARSQWMPYLDGEAGADLHRRLAAHLDDCPDCASWFARRRREEEAIRSRLTAGGATPALWARVLAGAGVVPPRPRWARRLALAGAAALAAAVLAAVWLGGLGRARPAPPELTAAAAEWHARWARGEVRPDLSSTSDEEVDRYLKAAVPFPVHCPPRSDVAFAVQGAGVCRLPEGPEAAYIVGRVEDARVSILVLDRGSLAAFPRAREALRDGGHLRTRQGDCRLVSGLAAGNVVVVIGAAPPEALEGLLNAYGTYPDS